MRVVLAAQASRDFVEIGAFGAKNWGAELAKSYLAGLRTRLKTLGEHPERYGLASNLGPGLRSVAHRSHRIFYLIEADRVFVTRILHQQADARRHLR